MGNPATDVAAVLVCAALVVAVAIGMFGAVQGAGQPLNGWFGWHPLLMTLAFPCLMSVGRLQYTAQPTWPGLRSIEGRRAAHGVVMLVATVAMVAGYVCIFKAHWPIRKFFGYDFQARQWSVWARVAHAWVGYAAILLTIVQASVGMAKSRLLSSTGEKRYRFHGQLGKAIMLLGGLAVLLAIDFWTWSGRVKAALIVLLSCAVSIGIAAVRPAGSDPEAKPIRAEA